MALMSGSTQEGVKTPAECTMAKVSQNSAAHMDKKYTRITALTTRITWAGEDTAISIAHLHLPFATVH